MNDYKARDYAEAAMCAWEWIIKAKSVSSRDSRNSLTDWYESIGTAEARMHCLDYLAPYIDKGWEIAAEAGFDLPFDWHFVPLFMERCVNWATGEVHENWAETCRQIDSARQPAAPNDAPQSLTPNP